MKKKIILICIMLLCINHKSNSTTLKSKIEYKILKNKILNAPKILEFFSFFCKYCYKLEYIDKINDDLEKSLPNDIKIIRYHSNIINKNISKLLTNHWLISKKLRIEKKILKKTFEYIHKNKNINKKDLIKLFMKINKINKKEYINLYNSFTIKILLKKQNIIEKKINLNKVPLIIINGQYLIEYNNPQNHPIQKLTKKYIKLVKYLINKK